MSFNKIFLNQSSLKLILETSVVLTGATSTKIKYIKGDGITTGEFDANIENETQVTYSFTGTELDVLGVWKFWAYVIFSDTRNAPGESTSVRIWEEGK